MAGLRWRSSKALALLSVFALCFSLQQAPSLSAKDKVTPGKAALTADEAGDSSGVSGNSSTGASGTGDSKSAKKKGKMAAEKKKASKKGKQGADGSGDPSFASPSGNSTGSGVPTSGSGGQSAGPAGNATPGKANAGSSPKSAVTPRVGGGAAGKPAVAGKANGTGTAGGQAQQPAVAQLNANHPLVKKVMDVQNRNTANLMAQKGIIGTGTGLDDDGNVVIRVYTTGADSPKIPVQIENIPVLEVLTGPLYPYYQAGIGVIPTYQQQVPRAVPIGISAIWDPGVFGTICAAATLGCRLVDSNDNVYGLSNNHVWADENNNPLGTPAVQPSPLDDLCITGNTDNTIGTLAAFVPLVFDGTTVNPCDAAIIASTRQLINTSTLSDGYGVPTSTTAQAFLGQLVQKYGRTTGYTRGKVVGVNVTTIIGYASGICLFNDFIEIRPVAPFANFGNPGDSGSLAVDMDRNPVGLLVGGGGGNVFHNPIDVVLRQLEAVLIQQGAPAGTTLKVDNSPPTLIGKEGRSSPNSP